MVNKNSKQISVYMPKSLYARMQAEAKKQDRSMGRIARAALEEYLDAREAADKS